MDPRKSGELPKRSAIYVRVSTGMQADKDSLPMQRKDMIAYSELILGIPDYEIFEDAGFSGKNIDRPAYQKMMGKIRDGEFSHLLVWKIDRISRNLLDFSQMYAELKELGVIFISKNEQFDTSTAMGEAMLKIILVFAELERQMTGERVTATMISRASAGKWNGGKIPYGYGYDKKSGNFFIREDEAAVVRLIRDEYFKTQSFLRVSQIINGLGYRSRNGTEWSSASVHSILSAPFYDGIYKYNVNGKSAKKGHGSEVVSVPNHHPALFSPEDRIRLDSIRTRGGPSSPNKICMSKNCAFWGLLYCASCGSRLNCCNIGYNSDGLPIFAARCPGKAKSCPAREFRVAKVGEFVINYILNILHAWKVISEIPSPAALEKLLLRGGNFRNVSHIENDGLCDLYLVLSSCNSDDSYSVPFDSGSHCAGPGPEVDALKKEINKQERALQRLQDLYLYSDDAISEDVYISRRKEILSVLEDKRKKLSDLTASDDSPLLSTDEFIEKASHFLITRSLLNKEYIYYKNLENSVSGSVLHEYMEGILSRVDAFSGQVHSITFRNGVTNRFIYGETKKGGSL